MKILIVSRSFFPDNWPRAFRTTELAKEFARQGHYVKVITHKKSIHSDFEKKYNVEITDLGKTKLRVFTETGSPVIKISKKIFNRSLNWLFEYPNIELVWLVSSAVKKESGYDLLISVAHPHVIHWGVARIWKKGQNIGRIWVADCGDPFMRNENSNLKHPFYFKWVEKWFMRKADYISIPNTQSIKGYYPEFQSKLKIIPQGFRFEDVKLYQGKLPHDRVIFGYAGTFIPGIRDPSELLEYLNTLDDAEKFEFYIYTYHHDIVRPFIKQSKGRIILKDVLPRNELLFELSKMHFVVNFENADPVQSPSKLIDYAIIKKPVLNIRFGNLDKEIVQQFLSSDFSHQKPLPDSAQFRIEHVVSLFLELA